MDGGSYFGQSTSTFVTEFTITEPVTYEIEGETLWDDQDRSSSLRFAGLASGQHFVRIAGIHANGTFYEIGALPPDTYELRSGAWVSESPFPNFGGFGEFGSVNVTLRLFAPCVGDLDGDSAVGVSDLSTLLSHYGMQSGAHSWDGDLDDDGDVDVNDLTRLLGRFGATC
jgi:hypothetical protein